MNQLTAEELATLRWWVERTADQAPFGFTVAPRTLMALLEERDTLLRLLRELTDEVGSEPITDNRARRMGAFIQARLYLKQLTDQSPDQSP